MKVKRFVEKAKKKPVLQQTTELHKEGRAVIRELFFAENLGPNEKAFSHEWTKYTSSLFLPDLLHPDKFAMRKGNRSDYGNNIVETADKDWKVYDELHGDDLRTGYYIDLMAFIQWFENLGCSTFKELSKSYLDGILEMLSKQCNIVLVVGGRYNFGHESSLKAKERLRRQKSSKKAKFFLPHDNLRLPPWKGYLDSQENKQNREDYLLESRPSNTDWIPPESEIILGAMKNGPAKLLPAGGVSDLEAF